MWYATLKIRRQILFHFQHWINVDPQRSNNVDPTLKCWLGRKILNLWQSSQACTDKMSQKSYAIMKSFIGTIHEVSTFKIGDFQTPPTSLYAFKQQNDVLKTTDVRFCLDLLPQPQTVRTFMSGSITSMKISLRRQFIQNCIII